MKKHTIIAGIDIGSSKVTTLLAQLVTDEVTFESSVNIIGVSTTPSKGVKKGQIVDIEDTTEVVTASVEAAERMAGYNLTDAYISLGGAHISSQNSTGVVAISDPSGEVRDSDVNRVIDAAKAISLPASREIIHVIPRQFIVDGEADVRDPVGMSGVRLEVDTHLVTASTAALKNLRKTVSEVGVVPREIVFSGVAASFSTLTETEKELGCVLIDIGAGITSVAAYVDGALAYSSAIPVGARNVTNDLAIGLRVSLEQAEKIKLNLTDLLKKERDINKIESLSISDEDGIEEKKLSVRTVTEGIIKPRLNEIFSIVRLDLEKAGLLNRVPSGAVVTGGGALTAGAIECAKKTLYLPVRLGIPQGVSGLVDDILNPEYSTAVGLILYGAKYESPTNQQSKQNLNSISKKVKLPSGSFFDKIVDTLRNLLP